MVLTDFGSVFFLRFRSLLTELRPILERCSNNLFFSERATQIFLRLHHNCAKRIIALQNLELRENLRRFPQSYQQMCANLNQK